jgi:hypothetical protein
MASIVVAGDTSGTVTLAAPAVSGTTTLTLPTTSGTIVTTSGAQTIEFADGSASTPSITNSGDTNTGMFFPAADTIAFSEGGTEAMRLNSSGYVGLGTTTPSAKIHVVGSGPSGYVILQGSDANQWITLGGNFNEPVIGYTSTGALRFGTTTDTLFGGFTERMRIDTSGYLSLNRTSAIGNAYINIDYSSTSQYGIIIKNTSTTFNGAFLEFRNSAGNTCGSIPQNGTTSVSYSTSSDYRLKENIAPMTGALAKVSQLNPVTYTWKVDGSAGQGFIAHELQEIVPDCVVGEKDAVETYTDEEGNEQTRIKPQGVDTSFLVATLTAAIQEQQTIINDLKARIETLEAK